MKDVAVIGAGVTGLTLAHYLKSAGCNVIVLEAGNTSGGLAKTTTKDGFLLEHGPNSTYLRPALKDLIGELDLADELISPETSQGNALKRYVALGEGAKLEALPRSLRSVLSTPVLSKTAKLRLLREPFVSATESDDESVDDLITRRLGKEMAENIVSTVLTGLWAADTKTLSARSALPKLWSYERNYGSLLKGLIGDYERKKKTRPKLVSFSRGFSTLTQTLDERLGDSIIYCAKVSGIELVPSGNKRRVKIQYEHQDSSGSISTKTCEAQNVVVTTAAPVTSLLLTQVAPKLAAEVSNVPYAPLGITHLACASNGNKELEQGSGFLLKPKKDQALLGATFSSTSFPGRAPDGQMLITCFSGGARNPELADVRASLVNQQVQAELNCVLASIRSLRVLNRTYLPAAMPNYPLGHHKLIEKLRDFEQEFPEIRLSANWIEGIGIGQRIEDARTIADSLIDQLKESLILRSRQQAPNSTSKKRLVVEPQKKRVAVG